MRSICKFYLQTAIKYYETGVNYGALNVKKNAFDWLLTNLLTFYAKHYKWLPSLSVDLLCDLIDSSDLVVMQTEFALYVLLKVWMYMKIHMTSGLDSNQSELKCSEIMNRLPAFFGHRKGRTAFLHTPIGKQYMRPFSKLRLQHLINHPVDIKTILEDNIIPQEWLYLPSLNQWNSLIKIDNGIDSG